MSCEGERHDYSEEWDGLPPVLRGYPGLPAEPRGRGGGGGQRHQGTHDVTSASPNLFVDFLPPIFCVKRTFNREK